MAQTIAVAGKGGVGKTTIAAMVTKYLALTQPGSILAIDADPSSNFNIVLGLELAWTVGDIREEMLSQVKESLTAGGAAMGSLAGGMSKHQYLDHSIRTAMEEGERFDLIAMGRAEGAGCYCAVNHTLRQILDTISKQYAFVVIDNEAGLEHLSRRTTRDVDHLLIVTDPSRRGLQAAKRVASFADEIDIRIEHTSLIVNRLMGDVTPPLQAAIDEVGVSLLGTIPADEQLGAFELSGRPLVSVENDNPVYKAMAELMPAVLAR